MSACAPVSCIRVPFLQNDDDLPVGRSLAHHEQGRRALGEYHEEDDSTGHGRDYLTMPGSRASPGPSPCGPENARSANCRADDARTTMVSNKSDPDLSPGTSVSVQSNPNEEKL